MKTFPITLAMILLILLFPGCKDQQQDIEEDLSQDLSGIYMGEARLQYIEKWVYPDSIHSIPVLDTILQETFTLSSINSVNREYKVSRSQYSYFDFYYDIGNPEQIYFFNEDFEWGGSYRHDKNWEYSLKMDPLKESIKGYMLEEDLYIHWEEDSTGQSKGIYYVLEYEVNAKK